ncbi:MAG TPA: deoxyguanosinetriphosphate triphosphohydrolase [Microbacteriaceae bacterium]|nr:deoxyguanosinetriphosphate triphosphohydrolase [Microbacteriaceae bacterium]
MVAKAYDAHDRERALPQDHDSERDDFARDRARLVHSSALRRLAAKTQVLSPTAGLDFARNRLTHSLEVAQVGRELAANLGLDPDVVDTACLAHDLGHPPFGHNGERALNEWSLDIGGFEGNAQTFRLLTRLEPKVVDASGGSYGLNLTRASLDASCKYPWSAENGVADPGGRSKFGVYDDDRELFDWVRAGAPERVTCIEAEVMDLSDDIAYSVHDFEDTVVAGYVDPAVLHDRRDDMALFRSVAEWSGNAFSPEAHREAYARLAELSDWPRGWTASRADAAQLKNLTSALVGRWAMASTAATHAHAGSEALVRFNGHVIVPDEVKLEIATLKGVVAAFVMAHDTRQPVYARQRQVLTELAEALWSGGPALLDVAFQADWAAADSDAHRKRVIVDQIASLTDQSALSWHARLSGDASAI